ncbi:MAG: HAD family phosphatase [Lachnospiraceae bacterium]|nr:HAD family phosphatase [Lachnospiraceae bacterium]
MGKQLVIFDMDGTLIDSMPYWEKVGRTYLNHLGCQVPDDFEKTIEAMTLQESAAYMKNLFGLSESIEEILKGSMETIAMAYAFEIPPKPGMKQRVKMEKDAGNTLVILSNSEISCIHAAMKRTGMKRFFDAIYATDELGMRKDGPEIFEFVAKKHGFTMDNTHVYDDACHAIEAAKQAGCYVTAVYDATMKESWEHICQIADDTITFDGM